MNTGAVYFLPDLHTIYVCTYVLVSKYRHFGKGVYQRWYIVYNANCQLYREFWRYISASINLGLSLNFVGLNITSWVVI